MKKILITGCSGYIGQHLAKLLANSYEVYGIDIVEPEDYEPFKAFALTDLRKFPSNSLNRISFDTVIHLAAKVRVNESVQKPSLYYETNIIGTINALRGFVYDNFIFASTGAAATPNSPYAYSKLAGEQIVEQFCADEVPYTMFRFYNVIGSAGYPPTNPDGLFYNLIKAQSTGQFNLYGTNYDTPDGTCIRDYVHVMEICMAIELAIEKPSHLPGEKPRISNVDNLGHGEGHSVLEIINKYKQVNNCDFEVLSLPSRPGDVESSVLDLVSPYMKQVYTFDELMRNNGE